MQYHRDSPDREATALQHLTVLDAQAQIKAADIVIGIRSAVNRIGGTDLCSKGNSVAGRCI